MKNILVIAMILVGVPFAYAGQVTTGTLAKDCQAYIAAEAKGTVTEDASRQSLSRLYQRLC